jgi:gliding motility-associated-like protein
VSYPSDPDASDPVFVFCNPDGTQKGALAAAGPGENGPFNFSWYKWDDAARSFSILIKSESGQMTSSLSNLDEGGYRVNITGGAGYDTTLTGWIFLDRPASSAGLHTRTCDYVALKGSAAVDDFFYKDPANGVNIKLENGVSFLWSSNPASVIPFPSIEISPVTYSPPFEDVTYKLVVTDSMNCTAESSFFYESIHVKADFSVEPDKGEAPLEVTVSDKSVRGFRYSWDFGDNSIDSISNEKDPPPHIYYKPGEYKISLTIESDSLCTDSTSFEKIVVEPSSLNIPNVFTPDGDGLNDFFMVDAKSLKYLSVNIYSRSGIKVFDFVGDGEKLRDWTGWNGNVNNSSTKASPGIYYYIIRARGWDDIVYDSKEYRGFLYLYR